MKDAYGEGAELEAAGLRSVTGQARNQERRKLESSKPSLSCSPIVISVDEGYTFVGGMSIRL